MFHFEQEASTCYMTLNFPHSSASCPTKARITVASIPPSSMNLPLKTQLSGGRGSKSQGTTFFHLFPQCPDVLSFSKCLFLCFSFSGSLSVTYREGSHSFNRIRREMLRTHYGTLLRNDNREMSLFHLPFSSLCFVSLLPCDCMVSLAP